MKKSRSKRREGGLLSTSSRRQWDWEAEKTGSPIQTPERRESIYAGDIVPTASNSTIYVCPAGKRGKLVYATLSVRTAEGYIQILKRGVPTFVLHTYTGGVQTFAARYEDGIDLESGDSLTIYTDSTAGNTSIGSVQVIQEEYTSSYVVST